MEESFLSPKDRKSLLLVLLLILLFIGGVIAVFFFGTSGVLPPKNLRASLEGENVLLQWEPSPTQGVDGYIIYLGKNPELLDVKVNEDLVKELNLTLSLKPGLYYFGVKAVKGGEESSFSNIIEVKISPQPPTGLKIWTNETCLNSNEVVLHLKARNAEECALSNDGIKWQWFPYKELIAWNLSGGDGVKNVYYKCRNGSTESEPVVLQIRKDSVAPSVYALAFQVDNVTGEASITLEFNDNLDSSGRCVVFYGSNQSDRVFSFSSQTTEIVPLVKGQYLLNIVCYDMCGNSQEISFPVEYEVENATENVTENKTYFLDLEINDGEARTTSPNVRLNITSVNATECRFKNAEGGSWSGWLPASDRWTLYPWTLAGCENNDYSVIMECKDGNTSVGFATDTIFCGSGGGDGGDGNVSNETPTLTIARFEVWGYRVPSYNFIENKISPLRTASRSRRSLPDEWNLDVKPNGWVEGRWAQVPEIGLSYLVEGEEEIIVEEISEDRGFPGPIIGGRYNHTGLPTSQGRVVYLGEGDGVTLQLPETYKYRKFKLYAKNSSRVIASETPEYWILFDERLPKSELSCRVVEYNIPNSSYETILGVGSGGTISKLVCDYASIDSESGIDEIRVAYCSGGGFSHTFNKRLTGHPTGRYLSLNCKGELLRHKLDQVYRDTSMDLEGRHLVSGSVAVDTIINNDVDRNYVVVLIVKDKAGNINYVLRRGIIRKITPPHLPLLVNVKVAEEIPRIPPTLSPSFMRFYEREYFNDTTIAKARAVVKVDSFSGSCKYGAVPSSYSCSASLPKSFSYSPSYDVEFIPSNEIWRDADIRTFSVSSEGKWKMCVYCYNSSSSGYGEDTFYYDRTPPRIGEAMAAVYYRYNINITPPNDGSGGGPSPLGATVNTSVNTSNRSNLYLDISWNGVSDSLSGLEKVEVYYKKGYWTLEDIDLCPVEREDPWVKVGEYTNGRGSVTVNLADEDNLVVKVKIVAYDRAGNSKAVVSDWLGVGNENCRFQSGWVYSGGGGRGGGLGTETE